MYQGGGKLASIIIMFLFCAVVVFYMAFPKKEGFINAMSGETMFSIYKDPENKTTAAIDAKVSLNFLSLDDVNDMLFMRRCYQFPNYSIERFQKEKNMMYKHAVEGGMYVKDFDMITCSFKDVQSKIICELQAFAEGKLCNNPKARNSWGVCNTFQDSVIGTKKWNENIKCPLSTSMPSDPNATARNPMASSVHISCTNKIQGPVYALVFQAPYYRNDKGEAMTMQFNTSEYGFLPFNAAKGKPDTDAPIYYYVQLLFSRYNKKGVLSTFDYMRDAFLQKWDKDNFSKEDQCFIMLKNNSEQVRQVGGCATTSKPYSATCLGPQNPRNPSAKGEEKNTPSSYAILFEINSDFNLLSSFLDGDQNQPKPVWPGCGTFSDTKYKNAYPDVAASSIRPFEHWAKKGIPEGRLGFLEGKDSSGGIWDSLAYRNINNDIRATGVDPLVHLQTIGIAENRRVCLKKA